jgi:hypothetical protein
MAKKAPVGSSCPTVQGMAQTSLKTSWWARGRDLQTFRLAKFFTLTSFVVIVVCTVILTVLLSHRAQKDVPGQKRGISEAFGRQS